MKLQFRSDDPEARRFQHRTAYRLGQVLRRLGWLVARVKVQLLGSQGPSSGGVDKRCRVEVELRGADRVVLSAAARSWRDALDAALARLRQRVVEQLRQAAEVARLPSVPVPALVPVRVAPSARPAKVHRYLPRR